MKRVKLGEHKADGYPVGHVIKRGPFRFTKTLASDKAAVWQCTLLAESIKLPFCFHIKDYGPYKAGMMEAFTGWRVGSGGPFTSVGVWATFEEALEAGVPWLLAHFKEDAQQKLEAAEALIAALNEVAV